MRRKSLVLIVIAAGCGLIASIGISQVLDQQAKNEGEAIETVEIYVTNAPVAVKDVLTEQLVRLEKWPKDRVPAGAITDWESIEGRQPNVPLYEGEPILLPKLVDPNKVTGAAARIRKGYRVLPVKVTADMTSGLVQPGDMVDVLVVLRQGGGVARAVAKTILQNVPVFAVNEHIIRNLDSEGNVIQAKTVSLEVTPEQVELLTLASRMGDLSLSIRSPDDNTMAMDNGTGLEQLMGGGGEVVTPPKPNRDEVVRQSDVEKFLEFAENGGLPGTPRLAMNAEPEKSMLVIEPDMVRKFVFDAQGGPAREVTPGVEEKEPPAAAGPDNVDLDQFEPTDEAGPADDVESYGGLDELIEKSAGSQ